MPLLLADFVYARVCKPICAKLLTLPRHVAGTQWGNKKYMNMKHLEADIEDASIAG